jgi:hypothetical protein
MFLRYSADLTVECICLLELLFPEVFQGANTDVRNPVGANDNF